MSIGGETAVRLRTALGSEAAAKELIEVINAGAGPSLEPGPAIPIPTLTATTGTLPTADGSTTIADAAAPTAEELLDTVVELNTTVAALVNTLKNSGLILST